MPSWTTDQVLALAPDPGSAKAGQGLASPRKWVSLGKSERAAWGECQGSAKDPYQVEIDLEAPAFKCTCPSRKFPCKHGLGLFLLFASQPNALKNGTPPAWVAEWLSKRVTSAEKKAAKAEDKAQAAAADPEAAAKRAAAREAKVTAGLRELDLWLRDLIRNGLAAVQTQPYGFWEGMAARMVDAQAPGVARLLRDMAGIASTGEGWTDRLLDKLARLHLLLEGHSRLVSLPPATQADIRASIGWTHDQDELRAQSGVRDHWLILGQRVEEEDRLRTQRTWLWGETSRRPALVLHFAHATGALDVTLSPGQRFEGELVFFPGNFPLRALVKERKDAGSMAEHSAGFALVDELLDAYADALARSPWLERFPAPLCQVTPLPAGDGWLARDAAGHTLALAPGFKSAWQLLALSGGHPVTLFGEWDGTHLLPLSAQAEGEFVRL